MKSEKKLEISQSAKTFSSTMTSFKPSLNWQSLEDI
jgi:hypothetical protein